MPELSWIDMPIHQAIKADWVSPEILVEGSLNSGKTTVALDKEIDALLRWPGIPILLFRWTDDAVNTKLRPAFEELLAIRNISAKWDAQRKWYEFDNGSVAYCFGLKAVSAIERYNKLRGVGVNRICGDQVEEMDRAVAAELRARLRPDLTATVRGSQFPFQLTFIANPSDDDFWLSKEFPIDNHIKGRRLYSLSVFDNPRLPQESVDSLLRTYASEHPKHRTMVLGQRGLNVTGDPVYEGVFVRALHVRAVQPDYTMPLLEVIVCGKRNPCWLVAQQPYGGGLRFLGGVIGRNLFLEDFLPLVKQYRAEWFPNRQIKTCCAPSGPITSNKHTTVFQLRQAGFSPQAREDANGPDVRLAMIERLAGYMRKRGADGKESFGISDDESRWIVVGSDGPKSVPFLAHAFEAGYIWDEHTISVGHNEVRRPKADDWYEHPGYGAELLECNFAANRLTREERDKRNAKLRATRLQQNSHAVQGTSMDWAS